MSGTTGQLRYDFKRLLMELALEDPLRLDLALIQRSQAILAELRETYQQYTKEQNHEHHYTRPTTDGKTE